MLKKAKALRAKQTDAELRLWYHLRAGRFLGLKFRRQHPVGPYIADFVCLNHRLIVEADGGQHNASQRDVARDVYLNAQGYRVLRYWNHDVLKDTEAVLEAIRLAVGESPSPSVPLPRAGGKEVRSVISPRPLAGEGLGERARHRRVATPDSGA